MRRDKELWDLREKVHALELKGGRKTETRDRKQQQSGQTTVNGRARQKKVTILDQWVEIEAGPDGKTLTTLFPPNQELMLRTSKMSPQPELVYRRLYFVNGIPPEYAWTTDNESIRASGGMGIQRMTLQTWLRLIERELEYGHLLPTVNLPRPKERGGCECDVCANNSRILAE